MLACAGDVPTLEVLAAADLLRRHLPDLAARAGYVVDIARLMRLRSTRTACPTRSSTSFTRDKPVIFAYHGYPWLIHRLAYRRTVHPHLHVRGYKDWMITPTPFDMAAATTWTATAWSWTSSTASPPGPARRRHPAGHG